MTQHDCYESLPLALRYRWTEVGGLVLLCFDRGMTITIVEGEDCTEGLPDWVRAIYSGPAAFIRHLKDLRMTQAVAEGTDLRYGSFQGDRHELGHAVWYLLLTPRQRWIEYARLYGYAKVLGRLIPYNRALPSIEESFAQDFEAFWTDDSLQDQAGMGRGELSRLAPTRFAWLRTTLKRLEA